MEEDVAVGVAGLGGEPDDRPHVGQLAVGAGAHRAGEHVVVAGELDAGVAAFGSLDFLILLVWTCVGRKSATAAAITSSVGVGRVLGHRVLAVCRPS